MNIHRRMKMLEEHVAQLVVRLEDANRRIHNTVRPARVTEVDPAKGLVKVAYAVDEDGQDVISPWIPWTQRAGSIREWSPPAVGEQVRMHSPSGDVSVHSWIDAGGFSDQYAQNHDKGGEYKLSVGDASILVTGDKIILKAGTIVTDGNTHLGGEGGKQVHRKDDIDDDGDKAVTHASKVWAV